MKNAIWYKISHEQLGYSLTRLSHIWALKMNIFRVPVFSNSPFLSSLNDQRFSCSHKNNCWCLCHFYHNCAIQNWLIGLFLKVSKFEFDLTLSKILLIAGNDQLWFKSNQIILGIRKTNCSSNDCEPCLFIVNSSDIIWSSLITPSSFIIYFELVHYEIFLSLKYLLQFFVSVVDTNFL